MTVPETRALTRRFGGLVAVDALTIAVAAGEVFGLLGPNGAGKSTAIKMLTTLLPPTSGTATVGGFNIVRQAGEVRRVIGYVPQMISADGALTGYENLLVFARLYDIPRAGREARIRGALELMGLAEAADRLVRTYSGGMIRRLEIAQSMLHQPQALFLDEPTVGLDPLARETVWQRIEHLLGILHKVLASPTPRAALVLGKALGHRRLGLFMGHRAWPDNVRAAGVRRAFAEAGVSLEALHVFDFPGHSDYATGARLADAFLQIERRPTGVVILNDLSAAAFVAAVRAAGVRVPEDVSVVGHDNQPWGAYLAVPLTTVTHPYEQLAEAAARMVYERLSGEVSGPPRRVVISSEIIVRASTAPPT